MRDERPAVVRGRADRELWARRSNVDEAQEVGRTAMRRNTTGNHDRGLKPHTVGQRSSRNEIDIAMQHDQPPAVDAVTDLMLGEPDFQEFVTFDEAGL